MRIVAGAARGRRLAAPPDHVRPTPDRVREALFSALAPRLVGARVLDGYAGSGALGLEARSRGAAAVVLVERDARARATVTENVRRVGLDAVRVVGEPLERWLAGPDVAAAGPFDVVLLDPPYALDDDALAAVLDRLVAHLSAGAEVVVERASRGTAPRWPAGLVALPPRRYGSTTLHRARRRLPDAAADPLGPTEPTEPTEPT